MQCATSWNIPAAILVAPGTACPFPQPGSYSAHARQSPAFSNIQDPLRVIFTANVTHALNLAICGLLKPGDHVVTSSIEHNSVMRPLRALEKEGIKLTVVQCKTDGCLDLEAWRAAVTPGTRLVVVTHASNVMGTLLPVSEIATIAHKAGALIPGGLRPDCGSRSRSTSRPWELICWLLPVIKGCMDRPGPGDW